MVANWITLARSGALGSLLLLATSGCAVVHRHCDDGCNPCEGEALCDRHPAEVLLWPFHWLGLPGGGFEGPAQPIGVSPQPRLFPVPTRPVFAPPGPPVEEAGRPNSPNSPRTANYRRTQQRGQRQVSPASMTESPIRPVSFAGPAPSNKSDQEKPAELESEMIRSAAPIPAPGKYAGIKETRASDPPKSTLVMRVLDQPPPTQQPAPASNAETSALEIPQTADSTWRPIIRQR
jgi:hypothetical protein